MKIRRPKKQLQWLTSLLFLDHLLWSELREDRGYLALPGGREIRVSWDQKGLVGCLVLMVSRGWRVRRGSLVHKDCRVNPERLDHRESRVFPVYKVNPVHRESLVKMVKMVKTGLTVSLA
jgi:hypothetical protein